MKDLIEIKDGKFNCWRIDYKKEEPARAYTYWFAPGVGLVRLADYRGRVWSELVSYSLK